MSFNAASTEITRAAAASTSRSHARRERLLARWRLSTVIAGIIALVAIGAILAAGLSLGGFGIPTDASPKIMSSGLVPTGLLSTAPVPPSDTSHPRPATNPVVLYFIGPEGFLTQALVTSVSPPNGVTLSSQLQQLLNGPGALAGQVQTDIPADTLLFSAKELNGIATINLSSEIENASGQQLIDALAQLVFTATTTTTCPSTTRVNLHLRTTTTILPKGSRPPLPCVDKVIFEVDGVRQSVPTETGAETAQPLGRSAYASLFP
jgi:spore germination protein GerM